MKIVADDSIPYVKEAFSTIGEVVVLPTREITNAGIRSFDVLLVRTMTRVDQNLLDGTNIRFVATNAVGTDHIDLDYLKESGIGFANAKGCNSNSVAEYVFAALFSLAHNMGFALQNLKLGVVGVGNIGSIVARKAEALGMIVKKNDPPLRRKTGDPSFLPLDDLMDCDIITLHVPLTYEGNDATDHLFNRDRILKMKPGSILINTSRGGVVETEGLIETIDCGHLSASVIDVWENEPDINIELVKKAAIATPHIAGYSYKGRVNGTNMIYSKTCDHFGIDYIWNPDEVLSELQKVNLEIGSQGRGEVEIINDVIKEVYDIRKDTNNLSMIAVLPEEERPGYFIKLRNNYPIRREFFNTTVHLKGDTPSIKKQLAALGFRLQS